MAAAPRRTDAPPLHRRGPHCASPKPRDRHCCHSYCCTEAALATPAAARCGTIARDRPWRLPPKRSTGGMPTEWPPPPAVTKAPVQAAGPRPTAYTLGAKLLAAATVPREDHTAAIPPRGRTVARATCNQLLEPPPWRPQLTLPQDRLLPSMPGVAGRCGGTAQVRDLIPSGTDSAAAATTLHKKRSLAPPAAGAPWLRCQAAPGREPC